MSAQPSEPSAVLSGTSPTLSSRLTFWAPLVVPVLYVAVVFAVQPDDHMGPPDWAPQLRNVLYDDVDVIVMAQRGLSAQLGQVPGLMDHPEVPFEKFPQALDEDRQLGSHYFLEYPHTALFVFRLGFLLQPTLTPIPSVVLDSSHVNILHHRPRNDHERELWRGFRRATRIYMLLMLLCHFALVAVLRSGYQPDGELSSMCLLLVLPSAVYYTINRFDIVPALLCALCLWCLGRKRIIASALCLAVAAAIKVYPALLAPLVVRYLWEERRQAFIWSIAFGATLAGLLALPLLQHGWDGFLAPYRYQASRVWTMPMTIYDALLPAALGGNTPFARAFRLGAVLATVGILSLPRMPDLASLLRRSAVALIVFQCVQIFYSPQFIIWLVPFLLPLTRRHRGLFLLVAVIDVLTIISFPAGAPTPLLHREAVRLRYVLFVLLIVLLLAWDVAARSRRVPSQTAAA